MSEATRAMAALPVEAAQAIVKTERELRREALQSVVDRNPHGKLAAKALVMISDVAQLNDWVAEAGGEDEFVRFLCARLMGGETLPEFCEAFAVNRGLVGALLTSKQEYYEQFKRAQEWRAEEFVMETVPIADAVTDPEMLPIAKWKGEARFRAAGLLNSKRFGTAKTLTEVGGAANVIDAALTFAAAELLNRIKQPNAERVVSEQ